MQDKEHSLFPYALSGFCGLLVCFAITMTTEAKVAWESSVYDWIGIPLMCLVIFSVCYFFPREPVRWTLAMWASQFVSGIIFGSSLAFFPLARVSSSLFVAAGVFQNFGGQTVKENRSCIASRVPVPMLIRPTASQWYSILQGRCFPHLHS